MSAPIYVTTYPVGTTDTRTNLTEMASAFIPSDGTFTAYTKTTDVTLDSVDQSNAINVTGASIDEINGWVSFIEDGTGNDRLVTCKFDGSSLATLYSGGSPFNLGLGPSARQTNGGTIQVWADGNANYYVSCNGALITTIVTTDVNASVVGLAISITGKYIAIIGGNSSDTKKAQLLVYTGS
jgi:hypothetical protein